MKNNAGNTRYSQSPYFPGIRKGSFESECDLLHPRHESCYNKYEGCVNMKKGAQQSTTICRALFLYILPCAESNEGFASGFIERSYFIHEPVFIQASSFCILLYRLFRHFFLV
ncbi:MAG: hypothetical protein IJP04_05600 [Clostridia bacterium]|nr:hypothetical protein [Clostridia bacterium]